MAEFIVTAEEIMNKASELRKINSEYKKAIEELEAEETRLNTMWEGQAHDNFDAAFKRDKVDLDNFYIAIENYCSRLEEIASNYASAEAKNYSIAGGQ